MAAPKGNRFWEARSSHGRKPIFETPDDLWKACLEYFEWVEENPLYEMRPFAFQGIVTQEPVPKMRAMTIMGLCNFLDIAHPTWEDYRRKEGFSATASRVDNIIRQQKFEGASADMLNPSIIARDLGLADRRELSGPDGGPIQTEEVVRDADDFARRVAGLAARSAGAGTGADDAGGEGGA